MIYTLVYVSSATHLFSEEELAEILRVSRENNTQRGITGLLLYADGNVIQILEGEKSAVETLYSRIAEDSRHRSILRLFTKKTDIRSFPEWSMGYALMTQAELSEKLPGYDAMLEKGKEGSIEHLSGPVETLINTFRKTVQV